MSSTDSFLGPPNCLAYNGKDCIEMEEDCSCLVFLHPWNVLIVYIAWLFP